LFTQNSLDHHTWSATKAVSPPQATVSGHAKPTSGCSSNPAGGFDRQVAALMLIRSADRCPNHDHQACHCT